jgi:hypothetical protein
MDWRLPGPLWQAAGPERVHDYSWHYEPWSLKELFFFILKILHEGHTPAAEAASTEGQQQDTAITL